VTAAAPDPWSGEEIARHYAAAHRRLVELVSSLPADELATPVPVLPGWDVHDVLAHLAAIPTDAMAGRLSGIPTDEHTREQTGSRRDRSVRELVDEWAGNVEPMCEGARAGLVPPNLAVDALTHEQDIRGALGLAPVIAPDELRFCVSRYAFGVGYGLKQAGVAALRIRGTDTDLELVAGVGEPAVTVRGPEFELFRALSGRRGRDQVLAFDWSGDPAPYAERFNLFGALPEGGLTG
jgi:uncharacterized protein (TIGR03083 family)